MRTIHIRALSVGALALLTFVGGAAAQTTSSAVLNLLEVRELITRAEPADHVRLSAHFSAIAERYAADANRHTAMALAFIGSPTRRTAANSSSDHCKRLAQLNLESASTLHELAAHHEGLAAGKTSAVPRGAARFEGGAGAPAPTTAELTRWRPKPARRRIIEGLRSTSRRWPGATRPTPTITPRWRKPIEARGSPRPPRIATAW